MTLPHTPEETSLGSNLSPLPLSAKHKKLQLPTLQAGPQTSKLSQRAPKGSFELFSNDAGLRRSQSLHVGLQSLQMDRKASYTAIVYSNINIMVFYISRVERGNEKSFVSHTVQTEARRP